jgi:hypothetical protein
MVNGPDDVYLERKVRIERVADRLFEGEEAVLHVIERIVAPLGLRIDWVVTLGGERPLKGRGCTRSSRPFRSAVPRRGSSGTRGVRSDSPRADYLLAGWRDGPTPALPLFALGRQNRSAEEGVVRCRLGRLCVSPFLCS